jgi:hypothetical protein
MRRLSYEPTRASSLHLEHDSLAFEAEPAGVTGIAPSRHSVERCPHADSFAEPALS